MMYSEKFSFFQDKYENRKKHPVQKTKIRFSINSRRFMFCEPKKAYKFQIYLSIQFTLPTFPYFLNMFLNKKVFFLTEG